MTQRLTVKKTYKLYIGGAFPRSESGYTMAVHDKDGNVLAQASQASRKDLRDAVKAARSAAGGWAGRTAYNRGQVLYRVAEVLEGRRGQFVDALAAVAGPDALDPEVEVDASIDRWVWYAGWTDKLSTILGSRNPVAGPFLNVSHPEPMGVVGVVAPDAAPLLGLTSVLAPVLAGGNVAVLLASQSFPLVSIDLAEVFATSDVPGGVANVLTGKQADLLPWLAGHRDVDAIDATGIADADLLVDVQVAAADNLKRVKRPHGAVTDWTSPDAQSPWACAAYMETKTVWHPAGR